MIGVFDSGIGGLSVLKALLRLMPQQDFFYLADSGYSPYGERDASYVLSRTRLCLHVLLQSGCRQVVIACNTATAAAASVLRAEHPAVPLVGIEPAIKPAAALSHSGNIGVLATRGTLASAKFQKLLTCVCAQNPSTHFHLYAPHGLALAIEQHKKEQIEALVAQACTAMIDKGCDTVVLGCTHYPLVIDLFKAHLPGTIQLVDPADAVAQQTHKLLPGTCVHAAFPARPQRAAVLLHHSTGDPLALKEAMARYLPSSDLCGRT